MAEKKNVLTGIVLLAIIGFGVAATWSSVRVTVRELSSDALEQARLVAGALDRERLARLTGSEADVTNPDYLRLKEQLSCVRLAHRTCRFLYVMGRRADGTVFFFLDSQPPDSKDYAPPGLVYSEVSDEYLHAFDTGEPATVGPIHDRWGTLVTSLVPIRLEGSPSRMALLGMDIEADDWNREVLLRSMLPVGLTAFIVLLGLFLVMVNRSRRRFQEQYREKSRLVSEYEEALTHIKTLQGILPICAKCKKIRDSRGYWSQVEQYISDHSDVDFSHSLCPECAAALMAAGEGPASKDGP